MSDETFLGTGWAFPPSFNLGFKTAVTVSNAEDIAQSLEILLTTRLGERVMRPEYGCDLNPLLFENITVTLLTKMKKIINMAILEYEPRISLGDINFTSNNDKEGVLYIEIEYTIRTTNSRKNFVFPFYLEEGTYIN
jgi:uncharacterized protein